MLDMGFIHDVKRVIGLLPSRRQTLFFSATMPREAQELADRLLHQPEMVAVTPSATTAEKVEQEVFFVEKSEKRSLLVDVLRDKAMKRVLVFSRTKHGANRIAEHLLKDGIGAEAIHGNKSQGARERALSNFKAGRIRVLVATDIAARGIDIDEVTHVVNFDVPEVPETYVHRIGRTARAGASGMALTFVEVDERIDWRNILKLTRQDIPVVEGHPFESRVPMNIAPPPISPRERAKRERDEDRASGVRPQRPNGGGGGGGGGGNRRRRSGGRGFSASR
jgi:ATP-dependent RNA helicase RhlE